MSTKSVHGDRATFPSPSHTTAAPLYEIAGEILEYCRDWDEAVYVNPSSQGFTFYTGDGRKGTAFTGLQPGRLLIDPSIRSGIRGDTPAIIREGLEDGWLTELNNDNWKGSFRVKAPLGSTLTPPQVEAIRISLQRVKQSSPVQLRR